MSFDLDPFVGDTVEDVADALQHLQSGRFDVSLAGVEEDALDHVDVQFPLQVGDGDLAAGDLRLHFADEFIVGTFDLGEAGLAGEAFFCNLGGEIDDLLLQPAVIPFESVDGLAHFGHGLTGLLTAS